jgi:hypothetical protein
VEKRKRRFSLSVVQKSLRKPYKKKRIKSDKQGNQMAKSRNPAVIIRFVPKKT